uniref:Uncharacterized protein n=1 Tax=Kalanchoe fedtschenkoi TaxID=63787 RepID=A0A7N1A5M5_KALFE
MVLSLFGCSPGIAWTVVHLSHFLKVYLGGDFLVTESTHGNRGPWRRLRR